VAGNETTRNATTHGMHAFLTHPEQWEFYKRERPDTAAEEIVRWAIPVVAFQRTATQDTELGGKQIRKGDRVVMWYVSGNRDEEMFENGNDFDLERKNARNHLSFGFGIHRCLGMRLAQLQLRIVWEEILKRFDNIEVVDEPKRIYSNFIKGYETLPARIAA